MNDVFEKIDLNSVDWKSSREFFESLGEALDKLDDRDESYSFTWVGKRKSIIEAGAPINKILRPDVEASKDFDNTKNMLIVGDNLDALKLLQESYLGKIKMIYIDPPYNTGHDFVYHDNFTIKKSDFSDAITDSDGNIIVSEDEYTENSKANGRFHSDWLSMMYPRLKLARNLLTDDGVIFISIDDNEQSNLAKMCDEIFGEENFIATAVRRKNKLVMKGDKTFKSVVEPIVIYAKQKSEVEFSYSKDEAVDSDFSLISTGYGVKTSSFKPGQISFRLENGTIKSGKYDNCELLNDITIEDFKNKNEVSISGEFKWSQDKIQEKLNNNAYILVKNPKSMSMRIHFIGNNAKPLDYIDEKYGAVTNEDGIKDLKELGLDKYFSYPKPVQLIQFIENIASSENCYILDFFAGSGTTGHATFAQNVKDGGNRHFINVQIPELVPNESNAKKAGYDTIDQITAERLRRAGEKIKSEYPESGIDTGFRVFRIDSNNENKDIRKPLNQINQSDLFNAIDNIKKDRTPLDLLFGVIYASALPFDLKLETRKIGENTVYLYGYLDEGTGLVACFDDNISEETFKEIAKLKALTAAFKDSSFTNSAAKINLSEHFRIVCPDTKVKVI